MTVPSRIEVAYTDQRALDVSFITMSMISELNAQNYESIREILRRGFYMMIDGFDER